MHPEKTTGLTANLGEMLAAIKSSLAQVSETASLDAQVLVASILKKQRTWVLAHPEAQISPDEQQEVEKALARLLGGEPLPYVLGNWAFYGLDFRVTPATLIPRPETELLVEKALDWLKANPSRRRAADVGTGSGCIAVSLAAHRPGLHIAASDLSWAALEVARQNAERHNVAGQIQFMQADLLPLGGQSIDLLCANLPYIPTDTLATLEVHGREPSLALDGGPDGLQIIGRLLGQAPNWMARAGLLLFEIEAGQGQAAAVLGRQSFPAASVQVLPDLAERDRLLVIEMRD